MDPRWPLSGWHWPGTGRESNEYYISSVWTKNKVEITPFSVANLNLTLSKILISQPYP